MYEKIVTSLMGLVVGFLIGVILMVLTLPQKVSADFVERTNKACFAINKIPKTYHAVIEEQGVIKCD